MELNQTHNANQAPEIGMEVEGDRPCVAETPDTDRSENDVHSDRPPVCLTAQGQAVDADNVPALLA